MREILYRGKTSNGEWLEGFAIFADGKTFILFDAKIVFDKAYPENKLNFMLAEVIPETIGQYTGLTDKNGTKIFEGDIVETNKRKKYEVRLYKSAWAIWNDKYKFDYEKWDFFSTFAQKIKVIGNIHDNPELLGTEGIKNV